MGPGEEGEPPREEKAHEGHGPWFGPNNRPRERTLAGSKALKWGLSFQRAASKRSPHLNRVITWVTGRRGWG
jgi:hypothetical protein